VTERWLALPCVVVLVLRVLMMRTVSDGKEE
jgi:hypothetical protein